MGGHPMRKATREALEADAGGELFKQVLSRIAGAWEEPVAGEEEKPRSPMEICHRLGLSYGAFIAYVHEDAQRYDMWLRALETRAQLYADETIEIADGAGRDTAHLAKLRIEARMRVVKAWHRRLYGDDPLIQISQVITDPGLVAAKIAEIERRLGLRGGDSANAAPKGVAGGLLEPWKLNEQP
jgi:terminase small subunit-like protein